MKRLLTFAFVLAALAVVSILGLAQKRGESKAVAIETNLQVQPQTPSLPCCECLGKTTTLNLSTGQATPKDPIWSVNNGFAFTTPKVSSWTALPPAQWIQPVATPTPSSNIAPGVYKYIVRFNVPKCTIPSDVHLDGKFSADNSAKAFLDGHPAGTCTGPTCFLGSAALAVNSAWLTPGTTHTLEIDVTNNEGYSGLIVKAALTRQCARGNGRAEEETTDVKN